MMMVRAPPEPRACAAGFTAAAVPTCCARADSVTSAVATRAAKAEAASFFCDALNGIMALPSEPRGRPEGDREIRHVVVRQVRCDPGLGDCRAKPVVLVELNIDDAAHPGLAIPAGHERIDDPVRVVISCLAVAGSRRDDDLPCGAVEA